MTMACSADDDNEELSNEIKTLLSNAPRYLPAPFEDILPYIDKHSITARMFRNEYLAAKDGEAMKGKMMVLAKNDQKEKSVHLNLYHIPLPRNRSFFSCEEMQEMYMAYKASLGGCALTGPQKAFLMEKASCLKAENEQFRLVVSKVWMDESWKRKTIVNAEVSTFLVAWYKARIPRIENYPSSYRRVCSIPLTPQENAVDLTFVKQVHSIGKPARFFTLASANSNFTRHLLNVTLSRDMLRGQSIREKLKKTLKNDPLHDVSRDHLAEQLALQHQAQLVLTPSVLAVILSNDPATYEDEWIIPFCVKNFNIGDRSHKTIFMDKKLPPKSWTPTQMNSIFAKVATRTLFRKPQKDKVLSENQEDASLTVEELPEDDESLVEPKVRKEVKYNLWECRTTVNHSMLSKHHRKPVKILIKTSVKHKIIDSTKNLRPCVVSTKLDYQPEYGAEVSSFRELTKEWIGLMTHEGAILHRVRIDPIKGTTIMVEEKSIAQITVDCQRLHARIVNSQLSILQNLFDSISILPVGNYLLCHHVSDAGFMVVYHENVERLRMNLNLRELYATVDLSNTVTSPHAPAPWVPLDNTIITPTFHYLRRVPCVLPPSKKKRTTRTNETSAGGAGGSTQADKPSKGLCHAIKAKRKKMKKNNKKKKKNDISQKQNSQA